jgi:hypothetical protein
MDSEKKTITIYQAIARMRKLSDLDIPFSIEFHTYNQTKGKSNGYKKVEKAILRLGFSPKQSDKHKTLIAYKDLSNGEAKDRFFYLPLLAKFNDYKVVI